MVAINDSLKPDEIDFLRGCMEDHRTCLEKYEKDKTIPASVVRDLIQRTTNAFSATDGLINSPPAGMPKELHDVAVEQCKSQSVAFTYYLCAIADLYFKQNGIPTRVSTPDTTGSENG